MASDVGNMSLKIKKSIYYICKNMFLERKTCGYMGMLMCIENSSLHVNVDTHIEFHSNNRYMPYLVRLNFVNLHLLELTGSAWNFIG